MRPHTAVWRPRSRPHGARSWLRLRWRGGVGPRRVLLDRRRSLAASRTRGSGGAIVHSGEREARLYLVGVEPRLLLLELLHGDLREMGALALLGVSEACLERRDALSQRRDACGELTGVLRHVVSRALDADPAALGLVQGEAQILEAALLLPHTCSIGLVQ